MSRKQAILLAYSAGWLTGLLVLWLEGRDRATRVHAAQSFLGFGLLTLLGLVLLAVALIGLFSSLSLFRIGLWAAQGVVDPLDGRVVKHAVTYPEFGAIPVNADRQRIRRGTDRRGESQPPYEVHPHGRVGHARGRIGSKTFRSARSGARRMQF